MGTTAAIVSGSFSLGEKVSPGVAGTPQNTFIAAEVGIVGDIKAAGEVVIAGVIEGHVLSDSKVTVLEGGVIKGSIRAADVAISGSVAGEISASSSLMLSPTAVLRGDVATHRLVIEPGASFIGRCAMPEASQQEISPNS